jgi:3-dehydroquinate dehydratase-2
MKVLIINGPNLNLLGIREPEIYGKQSFTEYLEVLKKGFPFAEIEYFQSNHEGELIDKLHSADVDGIVMNPGGYSHTSIVIADAIAAINTPVTEVHISNVHAREDFRKTLITAASCDGVITGMGLDGYRLAIVNIISK